MPTATTFLIGFAPFVPAVGAVPIVHGRTQPAELEVRFAAELEQPIVVHEPVHSGASPATMRISGTRARAWREWTT